MCEKKEEITRLNPVARAIMQGLYDPESPLHKLLGMHNVLKAIWNNVVEYWKSKITKSDILAYIENPEGDVPYVSFAKVQTKAIVYINEKDVVVEFPKPTDININMMPFIMERNFQETKLPEYLEDYWKNIIQHCINRFSDYSYEIGKVGYLTIHESHVDEATSQRRPGIHTESPGIVALTDDQERVVFNYLTWGEEYIYAGLDLEGGIFMTSNVENSCRVWNCQIERPEDDSIDIVGEHGDIEHLREFLPDDSETMAANHLYWITDRTPHESLPLTKGTYRQYFRLVTSIVSAWFEDHSTKNPNGVVPDPEMTKIVKGSKFDGICHIIDP
jgi:hypothetical protein